MGCNNNIPAGKYGGNTYGQGTAVLGYGGGDGQDSVEDPDLVGSIMRLSSSVFIGSRTLKFGGSTFQTTTYHECKRLMTMCVREEVLEVQVQDPGKPLIVYLRLPAPSQAPL